MCVFMCISSNTKRTLLFWIAKWSFCVQVHMYFLRTYFVLTHFSLRYVLDFSPYYSCCNSTVGYLTTVSFNKVSTWLLGILESLIIGAQGYSSLWLVNISFCTCAHEAAAHKNHSHEASSRLIINPQPFILQYLENNNNTFAFIYA